MLLAMEALRQLKDIEAEAENIKKQALIKSRERVKAASEQAEKEFNSVVEEAQKQASSIVKEKEAEARLKTKPIIESGEKHCSELKSVSDEKVKKAVELVIERIVKFYGKS